MSDTQPVSSSRLIMSVSEVAAAFGWDRRKVYAMARKGAIPATRLPNSREVLFRRSEIEAILGVQTAPTPTPAESQTVATPAVVTKLEKRTKPTRKRK